MVIGAVAITIIKADTATTIVVAAVVEVTVVEIAGVVVEITSNVTDRATRKRCLFNPR